MTCLIASRFAIASFLISAVAWADSPPYSPTEMAIINQEMSKVETLLSHPTENGQEILGHLNLIDSEIASIRRTLPTFYVTKIANLRIKADQALTEYLKSAKSRSRQNFAMLTCKVSPWIEEGNNTGLIKWWEERVAELERTRHYVKEDYDLNGTLVAYALSGHDNDTKVKNIARILVDICNSHKTLDKNSCEQYRLAQADPGHFVDSVIANKKWMDQNHFYEKWKNTKPEGTLTAEKVSQMSASRRKLLDECAAQSPTYGNTPTAVLSSVDEGVIR